MVGASQHEEILMSHSMMKVENHCLKLCLFSVHALCFTLAIEDGHSQPLALAAMLLVVKPPYHIELFSLWNSKPK